MKINCNKTMHLKRTFLANHTCNCVYIFAAQPTWSRGQPQTGVISYEYFSTNKKHWQVCKVFLTFQVTAFRLRGHSLPIWVWLLITILAWSWQVCNTEQTLQGHGSSYSNSNRPHAGQAPLIARMTEAEELGECFPLHSKYWLTIYFILWFKMKKTQ